MNPKRNRNRYRNHQLEEDIAKREVVKFVELNTKKNITIREHYLYLDDVKTAITQIISLTISAACSPT